MDELDVRGYVPLSVSAIRKLGLDVVRKPGQDDADLLEIVNILREHAEAIGTSLAACAGKPVEVAEQRQRIREARRPR